MLLNTIKATLKILSEKNKGSYGNTNSVALHISYLFLLYYFCPKGSFSLVALLNKHLNIKSEHWPPASTAAGTLCFFISWHFKQRKSSAHQNFLLTGSLHTHPLFSTRQDKNSSRWGFGTSFYWYLFLQIRSETYWGSPERCYFSVEKNHLYGQMISEDWEIQDKRMIFPARGQKPWADRAPYIQVQACKRPFSSVRKCSSRKQSWKGCRTEQGGLTRPTKCVCRTHGLLGRQRAEPEQYQQLLKWLLDKGVLQVWLALLCQNGLQNGTGAS